MLLIQDKVPAFSPEKAKRCIEAELGAPMKVLFKEFEDRPIAAASLGQVTVYLFCGTIDIKKKRKEYGRAITSVGTSTDPLSHSL